MSGLEILGLAASVIQIADLGAKLSVKLFTFSRKVKNADKSIDSISQDIAATGAVLTQLGHELNKAENLKLSSPAAITTTRSLVDSCNKLFTELNEAIDGGGDGSGHKFIVELKRRLRFPFLEPQIELLRCNLERLKSSLLVILNVLILAEQLRSNEAGEILKDQHELLRTLVKEKDTSEQNFKRILRAVEASKDPVAARDTSDSPEQDSPSPSPLQTNSEVVLAARTEKAPTSGPASGPSTALQSNTQLTDHSLLMDKMLKEIGISKYRIDYGQRDRLQKAILKVHWDEWTHLRMIHGHERLVEMLTALNQDELLRYWTQMAEMMDASGAPRPPRPRSTKSRHEGQSLDDPSAPPANLTAARCAPLPPGMLDQARTKHQNKSDETIKDLLSGLVRPTEVARLSPSTFPQNLPTEASPLGFCKGAIRLLSPDEKIQRHAFRLTMIPQAFRGMVRCWQCGSCAFEGQARAPRRLDLAKKIALEQFHFDGTVYQSRGGGVRFKWVFLAKCHLPLMRRSTEWDGTFACVFCCVEGQARGWLAHNGKGHGHDNGGVATFTNKAGIIEHMDQVHRVKKGWPSTDMQVKTKCIVGQFAEATEEWDINLLPVVDDDSAMDMST